MTPVSEIDDDHLSRHPSVTFSGHLAFIHVEAIAMLPPVGCSPGTSCCKRLGCQQRFLFLIAPALVIAVSLLLAGCSPNRMLARVVADQLAAQAQDQEDDLELARDAAPFFLKLGESVLARTPDHEGLAETMAAGFVRYAWAFVSFDADKIESKDSATAARLRQRAVNLYSRAEQHAFRALEHHYPGLKKTLAEPHIGQQVLLLDPRHAGLAYWAAAAWGARISLSKSDAEAIAQLPAAVRLTGLLTACCADWRDGAVASLAATFEAGRPGGRVEIAKRWFDAAARASRGQVAAIPLARAEALPLAAGDREEYTRLINDTISIAKQFPSLDNRIMLDRALWLLETIDDRF